MWLRLREALQRDEVVMMQADRVMPGQKGSKFRCFRPRRAADRAGQAGAGERRADHSDLRGAHAGGRSGFTSSRTSRRAVGARPHPALLAFASAREIRADIPSSGCCLHRGFCEDAS
jgi:hypothetical protein